MQAGDGECTCGGKIMKGISVKPTKGDAVLFWSMVCFFNPSPYTNINHMDSSFLCLIWSHESFRDSMDSQIRGAYMEDVKFCLERNGLLLNG